MRYIRSSWVADVTYEDEQPLVPSLSVDDHECVDTGLLWADGTAILRAPNPIGFGRDEDW